MALRALWCGAFISKQNNLFQLILTYTKKFTEMALEKKNNFILNIQKHFFSRNRKAPHNSTCIYLQGRIVKVPTEHFTSI